MILPEADNSGWRVAVSEVKQVTSVGFPLGKTNHTLGFLHRVQGVQASCVQFYGVQNAIPRSDCVRRTRAHAEIIGDRVTWVKVRPSGFTEWLAC
jgi:hypothetical protein